MSRSLLALLVLSLAACQTEPTADAESASADAASADAAPVPESPEDGVATAASTLVVDYEGRLEDGAVFDSGERVTFYLPQLVPGVQEALVGMEAGQSKTFDVPPEKAYGAAGIPGVVPPDATLTFDVTVHEVQ